MIQAGSHVRVNSASYGAHIPEMSELIGTIQTVSSVNGSLVHLTNNTGLIWSINDFTLMTPGTITNTLEVTAEMNPAALRTLLNRVNEPIIPNDACPLVDGYYYKREVTYFDSNCIYKYTFYNKDHHIVMHFNSMQYPACCGISILYNFRGNSTIHFDASLAEFFQNTRSNWKPNIQFVAVKTAVTEEVYDEDDDEYYDKPVGVGDEYEYANVVGALTRVLKPTLIKSFINDNSDNQCDIYQAVNIFRE